MIKKQKALIVGGSNGIGLALAMRLVKEKSVLIVDKVEPDYSQVPSDYKAFGVISEIRFAVR